jgi:hypothetical protein
MMLDVKGSELRKASETGHYGIAIYINLFLVLNPNGDVRLCA